MQNKFEDYLNEKIRAHVSWLTPAWIPQRDGFDAKKWAEQFSRAGIQNLLFYSKFHDGYCVFKSKFRGKQPDRDYLKEFCDATEGKGINISIYYSAGIDGWTAHQHPEWMCVDFDGTPLHDSFCDIEFQNCCFNTGYRDFMLGQIGELVQNYRIAGIWLDLFQFPLVKRNNYSQGCYCVECRKKFLEWSGGHTLWDCSGSELEQKFRLDILKKILIDLKALVTADGVNRTLSFNGSGSIGYGNRMFIELDNYVDYLSVEGLNTNNYINYVTRLVRSAGKPFEIIAPISDNSISWSVRNTDMIILEAAIITANGGTFMACIDPTADGYIYDCQIDQLSEVKKYIDDRNEYLDNTAPVYDVCIWGHRHTLELPRYLSGWGRALLENHYSFSFLYPENDFSKYQLVIADGSFEITQEDKVRLIEYVKNGGNLIADYRAACFNTDGNEEYEKMLGVKYIRESSFLGHYLGGFADEISEDMLEYPVMVDANAYHIIPTTAKVLSYYHYPIGDGTKITKVFKEVNSSRLKISVDAAITINTYGKGKVVYIGFNFGWGELCRNIYVKHMYPKILASNIVKMLLKKGKLLLTNAPAGVSFVINKQDNRYIVHIFNNYYSAEVYYNKQRGLIRLTGIQVEINEDIIGKVKKIYRVSDRQNVEFSSQNKYTKWEVTDLSVHEMYVIGV